MVDLSIPDFGRMAQRISGVELTPVPDVSGELAGARLASGLADRVGRIADRLAQQEGKQQGLQDGRDPAFRPSGSITLRGQARDSAATAVYLSRVTSEFDDRATALQMQFKDDPISFNQGFAKLQKEFAEQHLFDDIRAPFEDRANDLRRSMSLRVLENYDVKRKDEQRASLVTDMATSENSRARLIALDPNAPDVDALVNRSVTEDAMRLDAQVASGAISAEAAAKAKIGLKRNARMNVLEARAGTLTSAAEVNAFRTQLQERLKKGELDDLDSESFAQLDTRLSALARQIETRGNEQLGALNRQVDSFLERAGRGDTPPAAELQQLEDAAKALGPRGEQVMALARRKLTLREQLGRMPVDEASAFLERAQSEIRSGGDLVDKIIGVESGNNPNAANPNSTAEGLGQFIDSTWLAMIDRYRPDLAGLSNGEKLKLKRDPDISRQMTGHYLDENRQQLQQAGLSVTAGNLYLAHFLGPGGARSLLSASDDAAAASVLGADQVAANQSILAGKTVGEVKAWADRKMGNAGIDSQQADILQDGRNFLELRRKRQVDNPLQAAKEEGTIAAIQPLTLNDPGLMAGQLGARIEQADAVARQWGRPVAVLSGDERRALASTLNAGDAGAVTMLQTLVQGGGKGAPALLREIAGQAPEMARAGALMASGVPAAPMILQDVAEGLRLRKTQNGSLASLPENAQTLFNSTLGQTLASQPDHRAETMMTARALYEARMAKAGIDPKNDDRAAEIQWIGAVADALGRSVINGRAYGGPVEMRNQIVLTPAEVDAERFEDVLGALTDADFASMGNQRPLDAAGRPYSMAQILEAVPVAVPGGYEFALRDPTSDDPGFLRRADGQRFFLDWAQWKPVLRDRVPDAFLGGRTRPANGGR
jgi:hypothetical protein